MGTWRSICVVVVSGIYLLAGFLHVLMPAPFLSITPTWVRKPELVILATGLCEIAGAIGIATGTFRRGAAIALAVYAVCVFPANIKHAMDSLANQPSEWQWAYHLVRLPLQPVIVWITLFAGNIVTWPMRANR